MKKDLANKGLKKIKWWYGLEALIEIFSIIKVKLKNLVIKNLWIYVGRIAVKKI